MQAACLRMAGIFAGANGCVIAASLLPAVQGYFFDESHAIDFMQGRNAGKNFFQSRLAQTGQAFSLRSATHFRAGATLDDHLANVVAEIEQLVDGRAAAIARVIAAVATNVGVENPLPVFFGPE